MCLCLAPTEFLAFPQKLQAAHYKEDSEVNKCELDPEVISVLQQLLLNSPTLWRSMTCQHTSCLAETLDLLILLWLPYCSAASFASLAEAGFASQERRSDVAGMTTVVSGKSWQHCNRVTIMGLLRGAVLNHSPWQTCELCTVCGYGQHFTFTSQAT